MSDESAQNPKGKGGKSDVKSPNIGQENLRVFGGMPDVKKIESIEKTNTPEGRSRAPEAAGF
jgi:hypothetical protein